MTRTFLTKTRRPWLAFILTPGLLLAVGMIVLHAAQAAPSNRPLLTPGNPVTNPIGNSYTAPSTTTISITYDEAIDLATVSTQTFSVYAMQTGLLTQTFAAAGGNISLAPTMPLKPGELVQVSATTDTLSLVDGTGPISPTVWQFWTVVDGGNGKFTDSGQSFGNSDSRSVALADLDGDDDLDAFVANDGSANKVWLNNGMGVFTDSGQALGNSISQEVELGDVDGDGDLDAFVSNHGEGNRVWLNDGTGAFSDSGQRLGNGGGHSALGDADGDGDLDAFVTRGLSQANEVWLNDGTGAFSDRGQRLGQTTSLEAALGDVDGDGDLDAFVANWGTRHRDNEANKVWLNDGTGTFYDSGQNLGNLDSYGIELGDVDGDGDLDAFVANGWGGSQANKVWLNDGTGTFSDSGQNLGDSKSNSIALGDVNEDGDLDVFVANAQGQANKVWINQAETAFAEFVYLPLVTCSYTPHVAFPLHIGDAIPVRPVGHQGEIFYTTSVWIPDELEPGGHFYLSSQPDAVAEVLVDDKLSVLLDGAEVFAYNFSTSGYPVPAIIEVPRTTMEQLAGQTVIVDYQDLYANVVEASAMWLTWIPSTYCREGCSRLGERGHTERQ